jgi:alginate O-acetyltransferase complex protein AlgI
MTFNSLEFILFMLAFMALWPNVRERTQPRLFAITLFSFVFYGWWDWRFLILLIVSGLIDYLAALGMERWPSRRRWLLALSMAGNLGILAFFKYARWAVTEAAVALGFDVPADTWLHAIVLPVGISFYTFQSMSYTIDVYRHELKATRSVVHFFAYLSMFPQLVAGPIVRAADLLPQLEGPGQFNRQNRWTGLERTALGFLKKCVIADNLAPIVNAGFAIDPSASGGLHWWLMAFLFAIQIYCDFSGYSDIAIGTAQWMGYSFRDNFRHPYLATSFREFWTRWHISLSTWFRDYVYIPLGGSRRGPIRGPISGTANLWITMLASGLWHGANCTFLVWGGLHAAYLTIERLLPPMKAPALRPLAWLVTFAGVLWAWVFFRADSVAQAWAISGRMLTPSGLARTDLPIELAPSGMLAVGLFIGLELASLLDRGSTARLVPATPWRFGLVVLALVASLFLRGPGGEFIYFQF